MYGGSARSAPPHPQVVAGATTEAGPTHDPHSRADSKDPPSCSGGLRVLSFVFLAKTVTFRVRSEVERRFDASSRASRRCGAASTSELLGIDVDVEERVRRASCELDPRVGIRDAREVCGHIARRGRKG